MPASERKRLIGSYWDLPVDVQNATARFLVGSKLSDIIEHKGASTRYEIGYHRNGRFFSLEHDADGGRLLGGNETVVIQEVLKSLPAPVQGAIQKGGGALRQIMLCKPDVVAVEFLDKTGLITDYQLDMTGKVLDRK